MPQSSWTLSPHAHAVAHDGDLVVLDVAADSYLCLPEARDAARLAANRREIKISDPSIAAALKAAGLILPLAPDGSPDPGASLFGVAICRLAQPAASAVQLAYPSPGWRDLGRGLIGLLDLIDGYWRRPFAEVLRRGLAGRPPVAEAPSPELLQAVDSFHRWIPYAPVEAKCLLRAFLLLRWLARRGHGAHWVFGVTTWPFRAHCWLQCGEMVLDDDAERVVAYSVILVL